MKLNLDTILTNRKGEPFYNGSPEDPLKMGDLLLHIIDGMAVGTVGDTRRAAKLADRIAESEGQAAVNTEELELLEDLLEKAKGIRFDMYRSLRSELDRVRVE